MLVLAGNIDDTMGGPATELDLPSNRRRTLYGKVGRDEQNDLLRLYDFPPPTSHSPSRDATTTPLQQLFVLNSEFVEEQARVLADRLHREANQSSSGDQIARCYQILFQRLPTEEETRLGEGFLKQSGDNVASESSRWIQYIQSLLGLNELFFVD